MPSRTDHFLALVARQPDNELFRFSLAQALVSDGRGAEAVPLTQMTSNSARPMAWKGRVVFVSDRDGVMNLWSMDRDGRGLRQHTRHKALEVRGASISGDRVVYQLGADIHLHDLASGQDRVVPIRLVSDFDHQHGFLGGFPFSNLCVGGVAGVEHPRRRERYAQCVIEKREEQILPYFRKRGARQPDRVHHACEVAAHQRDVSTLYCGVGPCSDGETGICGRQCWRIIGAVASHADRNTLLM